MNDEKLDNEKFDNHLKYIEETGHLTGLPIVKKMWIGTWPANCDMCGEYLPDCHYFVDGADQQGHWGLFCPQCVKDYHIKLGTGRGQKYDSKTLEKLEG